MHHTMPIPAGTTASSRPSDGNSPGFGEAEADATPPSGNVAAPSVSMQPGTLQLGCMPAVAGKVAGGDTTAPRFRSDDETPQPLSLMLAADLDGSSRATPVFMQSLSRPRTEDDASIQTWLDHGSYLLNLQCRDKGKALCLASGMGRADIVANILAEPFDAGAVADASGNTPLTLAAAAGHVDVVELLLQRGNLDPERRNGKGDSPLVRAVCQQRIDVVECLLAAEAPLSQLDAQGHTAFQIALSSQNAALVEVFIRHGQIPPDADLNFNDPDTIGYVTVIADLSADRRLSGLMLPAEESAVSYFKQFFDQSDLHQDTRSTLQWLREQGMSMACARLVAAVLGEARGKFPAHGANTRLPELYRLSALSRLTTPDTQSRMLEPYRTAGISAAMVEKLGTRATWQLSEIARFATVALEKIVAEMSEWVINICVDKTGLDGRVRTDSLSARLCKNGYLKPVAEAIAAGWQLAFTAVQEESSAAMPLNSPVRVTMLTTHAHITERTPAPFARELLRRLDSGELSAKLLAMSDGPIDETLQALLQFQRARLRQACLDSFEHEAQAPQQ